MSAIPEVDYQAVATRLSQQLGEKILHLTVIENLAETLRDERDKARTELDNAREELSRLNTSSEEAI